MKGKESKLYFIPCLNYGKLTIQFYKKSKPNLLMKNSQTIKSTLNLFTTVYNYINFRSATKSDVTGLYLLKAIKSRNKLLI